MIDNWTATQWKFIEWLSTPRFDRTPPNEELLAKQLGVGTATLSRWKKLDGFQDAVNQLARGIIGKKLPEVYGALLREAEKGSFQHIKLVLELSGDYVERSQTEHSGPNGGPIEHKHVTDLSDEELAHIASRSS